MKGVGRAGGGGDVEGEDGRMEERAGEAHVSALYVCERAKV